MAHHRFTVEIAAPRELVFDLWVDLDRLKEWIGGVTGVSDVTGPPDRAGSRYVVWFGRMRSPTEVLEAERPRLLRTRFGNSVLRGDSRVVFEAEGDSTRLTQEFWTKGIISGLAGRIFSIGSYKGSFRGELKVFARLAEREAAQQP